MDDAKRDDVGEVEDDKNNGVRRLPLLEILERPCKLLSESAATWNGQRRRERWSRVRASGAVEVKETSFGAGRRRGRVDFIQTLIGI